MPMKLLKTESEINLKVQRIHQVKRYSLTLDKNLCKGCGICGIVCPKEAIALIKIPKAYYGEKAKHAIVDVSEEKCIYCGICDAICPFGALKVEIDGEHVIPVIKTQSFPKVVREIQIDTTKCEVGCSDCEKACPLSLIKARKMSPLERAREVVRSQKDKGLKLRPIIEVKADSCAGCRLCEAKCPQGAIRTRKIFHGFITINNRNCPRGCRECLDVCPIPDALNLSENGKIHINEAYCVYCGVCKTVCPVADALLFQRRYIRHTVVHSGAWNKAFEKLTSTTDLAKELRARSMCKVRKSVYKRLGSRTS